MHLNLDSMTFKTLLHHTDKIFKKESAHNNTNIAKKNNINNMLFIQLWKKQNGLQLEHNNAFDFNVTITRKTFQIRRNYTLKLFAPYYLYDNTLLYVDVFIFQKLQWILFGKNELQLSIFCV